jgi:UDP-N-acetylmuramoyl-L-alanyl-D-glutamate--2,6-diaminopimelate ligase
MMNFLRTLIPERSKLRLAYHKLSAIAAVCFYRFPSDKLCVIGVTGTSGKSTTVELIHFLLQNGGHTCGAIGTIQFHIGEKIIPNTTLRTTLSPWKTQKMLRQMVHAKCDTVVLEVSSHALDQNRVWGIHFDTAVMTNISDGEHLDYHETFSDYLNTKLQLFKGLNNGKRKPGIVKNMVLNNDDENSELFADEVADRTWTFSLQDNADVRPERYQFFSDHTEFFLRAPNFESEMTVRIVGRHNLENLMAAIAVAQTVNVSMNDVKRALAKFTSIPGRLESISMGQDFAAIVDFSYKPSALKAVLSALRPITSGRIITVWGGAGGRAPSNWREAAQTIAELADEFILTTDDPYKDNPKKIAQHARKYVGREEGDRFFEIEDRYEAIRYALYTAQKGDTVLIAGRGHEKTQTIGKQVIPFDDREVVREILEGAGK